MRTFALALPLLSLAAASAQAQVAIPLNNPSFEADFAPPNSFPVRVPQGWRLYDPGSIIDQSLDAVGILNPTNSTFFPAGAPDGSNVALIFLSGDIGTSSVGLWQQSPATLAAGRRYMLRVFVGNIASGIGAPPFDFFYNLDGFPGYAVQLLAGPEGNQFVIAEDHNTLAPTLGEGQFAETSITIALPAGHPLLGRPLTVRVINLNQRETPENPGIEVDFDLVRLTQVDCAADFNADGFLDFFDYDAFVGAFEIGRSGSDYNADGFTDFFDYDAYVTDFETGC